MLTTRVMLFTGISRFFVNIGFKKLNYTYSERYKYFSVTEPDYVNKANAIYIRILKVDEFKVHKVS